MLHAFFLSALNGEKGVNWASDAGSVWDKALGIMWSNDWEDKSKTPHIRGSSRPHVNQRDGRKPMPRPHCEQLLIYMVAQVRRLVAWYFSQIFCPRGKVG